MKIGVFDSGVGGKSVANAIQKSIPEAQVIFVNDSKHVPYGLRKPEQIYSFIEPIFAGLVQQKCDVIVVACNTVSTTLIEKLRGAFTTPLIAMEPMVKPAAEQTKTGIVTICATPTTLASQRYAWLKKAYAPNVQVIEPDCSDWSSLIECNQMTQAIIQERIEPSIVAGSDIIVLGCTHYHWIEEGIKKVAAGRAVVLQPEEPVIAQLKRVLVRTA